MRIDRKVGHAQQMTPIDLGVIRSWSQWPKTVKLFLNDNLRTPGPRIMTVDRGVSHDQKMTPIDLGVKGQDHRDQKH